MFVKRRAALAGNVHTSDLPVGRRWHPVRGRDGAKVISSPTREFEYLHGAEFKARHVCILPRADY